MIVEDGSIVADANSYVDITYADAHFASRRTTSWANLTLEEKEGALINATDFIEATYGMNFKGELVSPGVQPLSWPRSGVFITTNYEIPDTEIPKRLKDAVCDLALKVSAGTELMADQDRIILKEKIDVIETTYQQGSDPATRFVKASRLLSPLLASGEGSTIGFARLVRR